MKTVKKKKEQRKGEEERGSRREEEEEDKGYGIIVLQLFQRCATQFTMVK